MSARRRMTVAEVLSELQTIDEAETEGIAGSDTDSSWSFEGSSGAPSESDSESVSESSICKKRRLGSSSSTSAVIASNDISGKFHKKTNLLLLYLFYDLVVTY